MTPFAALSSGGIRKQAAPHRVWLPGANGGVVPHDVPAPAPPAQHRIWLPGANGGVAAHDVGAVPASPPRNEWKGFFPALGLKSLQVMSDPDPVPTAAPVPAAVPAAAPVPAGPTAAQLAAFRRGTASNFDPASWLDRNKMDALMKGRSNWADNAAARGVGRGREYGWHGSSALAKSAAALTPFAALGE